MPGRPYILAETTWKTVKETEYEIAVLPWGACEAHNYHLPYATDNIQNEHVAAEAARRAWDQGAKVIVLPNVPFGVNTGQLDIKLDINLNPSTQAAILTDVVEVLAQAGIYKFVIMNGHGGNDFRQIVRELQAQYPDMFIATMNWYQVVPKDGYFDEDGDHADEMETSVMMHFAPDLVLPLSEAGNGAARQFKIAALRERWVWAQRAWSAVTDDTGVGNPHKSSAEKGRRYFDAVADKIASFFVELSQADITDLYE